MRFRVEQCFAIKRVPVLRARKGARYARKKKQNALPASRFCSESRGIVCGTDDFPLTLARFAIRVGSRAESRAVRVRFRASPRRPPPSSPALKSYELLPRDMHAAYACRLRPRAFSPPTLPRSGTVAASRDDSRLPGVVDGVATREPRRIHISRPRALLTLHRLSLPSPSPRRFFATARVVDFNEF